MVLLALIFAALYALYWPQPDRVVKFIYAKLYGNLIGLLVHYRWPDKDGQSSVEYGLAYTLITAAILGTIIAITVEAVQRKQRSWRGSAFMGLIAWSVALLCFFNTSPVKPLDMVRIAEGAILLWAALTLGCLAPYMDNFALATVLAWWWFAQALFRTYFYVFETNDVMLWLNWKLPPLLGFIAFLLLGWVSRQRIYAAART